MDLKDKFGGMLNSMSGLMGGAAAAGPNGESPTDMMLGKLTETREIINKVNTIYQDPAVTTFVCVCIPEFLSIFETERLVQELSKFGIDSHNVVINQVLFPEKDAEELGEWYDSNKDGLQKEAKEICSKMNGSIRIRMDYRRR